MADPFATQQFWTEIALPAWTVPGAEASVHFCQLWPLDVRVLDHEMLVVCKWQVQGPLQDLRLPKPLFEKGANLRPGFHTNAMTYQKQINYFPGLYDALLTTPENDISAISEMTGMWYAFVIDMPKLQQIYRWPPPAPSQLSSSPKPVNKECINVLLTLNCPEERKRLCTAVCEAWWNTLRMVRQRVWRSPRH